MEKNDQKEDSEFLEKMFFLFLERSPLCIIWVNLEGTVINSNSATEKVFGFKMEDILGKKFTDIVVCPQNFISVFKRSYEKVRKGAILESLEIQAYKQDNSVIWIDMQGGRVEVRDETVIQFIIQDITGQKEQEEKIKELSEAKETYDLIAENATDLIGIVNMKSEFEYINEKAFLNATGYSKEELLGRKSLDFIHPADLEQTLNAFLTGFEVGEGKIEARIKCKDGHYLWLELQGRTFDDKAGESKAIMIARDVTERKQIEEGLQESEARYKALFDRTLNCVFLQDFNSNYLDANEAALHLLGYSREELLSLDFTSLASADQLPLAFKTLEELKKTGSQQTLTEYRLKRKNGDLIWVETDAALIFRQGKPYAIQGIARDITERKHMEKMLQESEKKYRSIIENIRDAVVIIGLDGQFQFVSPQIFDILGRSDIKADLSHIRKFIHKDDFKPLFTILQKALQEKTLVTEKELEFRVLHQSGHYIWLGCSSIPHFDENGQLVGFIALLRDITDRKESEEIRIKLLEEMQSHRELEEMNRLKDEFYADISHELRTPLTIIKGFTELFLDAPNLDEIQKNDLQVILKNEVRLERLLNEMLDYSRLKSGQIQFHPESFRVSELVNELKTEFEPLIGPKKLVFEEIFNPDEELFLDKNQIMKVIRNLLSNAIKFSFPQKTIFITSLIEEGVWTFSIQDQGVGIPKTDITYLFSRFTRLKHTEPLNTGGIGIGLAICKKIIDLCQGRIWADSEGLNTGSTFSFQINLNNI